MTKEEEERDVHQPVVDEDRVGKAKARVALAVPEESAGHREQDGERGGHDRVELLACVEPTLGWVAELEPLAVVTVPDVDLMDGRAQTSAVAESDDQEQGCDPPDRGVDVDRLQDRPPSRQFGEAGQIEAEPTHEENDECRRVNPVHCAFGAAEPTQAARVTRIHSTVRPRRSGRSQGLPSNPAAGRRRAPSARAI